MIDRGVFFDKVRANPFPGSLTQQQVDGMNAILDFYEAQFTWDDLRWLAYLFATAKWETSSTMWPIEEYGKGGSADYAKIDPQTGQGYWGRGLVQLTWRENYARADIEMGWSGASSCEYHADLQLKIEWAAPTAFLGMSEGWFRTSGGTPNTLGKYFNATTDDAYNAREIINGDKSKVPSWSGGVNIGNYIAGDHRAFLAALKAAFREEPVPPPEPSQPVVTITIEAPAEIEVNVVRIAPDA